MQRQTARPSLDWRMLNTTFLPSSKCTEHMASATPLLSSIGHSIKPGKLQLCDATCSNHSVCPQRRLVRHSTKHTLMATAKARLHSRLRLLLLRSRQLRVLRRLWAHSVSEARGPTLREADWEPYKARVLDLHTGAATLAMMHDSSRLQHLSRNASTRNIRL